MVSTTRRMVSYPHPGGTARGQDETRTDLGKKDRVASHSTYRTADVAGFFT